MPCIRICAVILLAGAVTAKAQNDTGYWAVAGGGSWANPNNWDSGIIADGEDNAAYFGLSLYATIPPSATFTLDGARTIGDIEFLAQTGPDNWFLNTGTGGPLTLDNTFNPPPINVSYASQKVTINAVIAGTNGMEKLGSGTLVLAGPNTYTGETTVSAGTLQINGLLPDALTVGAGTLAGTGTILGPVSIQSGGTLAPANLSGIMMVSNSLVLATGSTTRMQVNASNSKHDTIAGVSTLQYGGTLVVSNMAGTPVLGQSFTLFSASNTSSEFTALTPQLTGNVRWRFDAASGVLSVVSTASQPWIAAVEDLNGALVLQVVDGAPGVTHRLVTSTNLALPMTNWIPVATNVFDLGGNSSFTNPISPSSHRQFLRISVP